MAVVSGVDEVIEMVGNLGKMPESFFEKFLPGDDYADFRKYLASMKTSSNNIIIPENSELRKRGEAHYGPLNSAAART